MAACAAGWPQTAFDPLMVWSGSRIKSYARRVRDPDFGLASSYADFATNGA
jgi:hypothetical protein